MNVDKSAADINDLQIGYTKMEYRGTPEDITLKGVATSKEKSSDFRFVVSWVTSLFSLEQAERVAANKAMKIIFFIVFINKMFNNCVSFCFSFCFARLIVWSLNKL